MFIFEKICLSLSIARTSRFQFVVFSRDTQVRTSSKMLILTILSIREFALNSIEEHPRLPGVFGEGLSFKF